MKELPLTNVPTMRVRCPICGNTEFIPLEKVSVKNKLYPDVASVTTAYCVGCGNVYGATIEKVVRV